MIARHWTGLCKRERALDYISHLENETFKDLVSIKGFVKASILKRETEWGVEFLITTHWESIDAIRQFAGPDFENAVVPRFVREIMVRYDARVRHYDIHGSDLVATREDLTNH